MPAVLLHALGQPTQQCPFQLQQVSAPTWLWHGAADQDVPIAAARRLARMIPSCQATFTDEGYLMGLRHAGEAVEAIRGATAA
jgi:pimeloyl-ACP methyl ester carboxylesterase